MRPRVLATAFVGLFCVSFGRAQIAFIRGDGLYVLPTDRTGNPAPSARPFLVARLWRLVGDDSISICWTPSKQIAITHYVDAWNDAKRFGLPTDSPISRTWLADAKPHSRLKPLCLGGMPNFSSDGRRIAYVRSRNTKQSQISEAFVKDLHTGKETSIGRSEEAPVWVPNTDALAIIVTGAEFDSTLSLLSTEPAKPARTLLDAVNLCCLSASPDGKWLAVQAHLSRPLTGHFLVKLSTGKEFDLPRPGKYAPAEVEDWSPDSQQIACSWRIPDPRNDGASIRDYVAVTDWPSGHSRRLGQGGDAQFSVDGKSILYLRSSGRRRQADLVLFGLDKGARRRTLLHDVGGYSVFKPGRSIEGTVFGPGDAGKI
jgi:hypothetical protein